MSDQKNNDQQDFDTLFSSPEENRSELGEFVETVDVVDVVDATEEGPSDVYDVSEDYAPTSDADFSDIDDGIDDEDEGIFAASPSSKKAAKKSSFGMLLFSAAALAIVGAGGYFYMTDPQLIDRIKSNFSGSEAQSDVLLPSFQLGEQTPPVEPAPMSAPEGTDAAPVADDMPPQPAPAVENATPVEGAPVDEQVASADQFAPPPADVTQGIEPPPSIDGAVVPEMVAENPVPAEGAVTDEPQMTQDAVAPSMEAVASVEPPPAEIPAENEGTPSALGDAPVQPAVEPVMADSASVVEAAPAETAPAEAAPAESKTGNVQFIRPDEKVDPTVKLVDDVTEPKNSALTTIKNDEVPSHAQAKPVVNTEEPAEEAAAPTYFDSPSGKILSSLPAPSMNPKRGKTESIIVVNPANKKVATKKSSDTKMAKSVTIETTSLDGRVVSAGRALKLGRYDAARQMYDELYQLNPRDPRILMGRAVLFQKVGESGQAIMAYKELLDVDPSNADAIVNLAGLIRKEYPAVALSKLLDLKERYPGNPAVAAQLGVAYADSGNLEDAFRSLSQAAMLEPGNPLHYYNMAIIAERAQDVPKAITFYEKALEVDAVHGSGRAIPRDQIYDRLTRLRSR